MKKTLTLILAFSTILFADLSWTTSYETAKVQADDENKSIFVMLSKEACDACWYMDNIVFEDTGVKQVLKENFILVHLDTAEDIPEEFKYIGIPTFYFMDKNGSKIGHRITGAKNVKEFSVKLKEILTP